MFRRWNLTSLRRMKNATSANEAALRLTGSSVLMLPTQLLEVQTEKIIAIVRGMVGKDVWDCGNHDISTGRLVARATDIRVMVAAALGSPGFQQQ